VVRDALDAIRRENGGLNAFHQVFADEALADAAKIDRRVADGRDPGPLAGVPFAAKSLFDIAGQVTIAGAIARRDMPPARADAFVVAKLREAGAVLVGTTHMDELACGATGVNPHFGAVRNPHDVRRMTGGSSSGSAAAVAAGLVPIALGSDTNGSIRAPAALCGVWGIKPTFGRVSRTGVVPYAGSLDCVGGFATNVADMAALYDSLLGIDDADARQARHPAEPRCEPTSEHPLRVGLLGGFFSSYASEDAWQAVRRVGDQLQAIRTVDMPEREMQQARSAATIVSNVEVAAAHRVLLDMNGEALSPRLRTRLLAGALCADAWYRKSLDYRTMFRARMAALFDDFDILLAPCTPFPAPEFGHTSVVVNGHQLDAATHLGMFTQPISFAGLPVVTVPIEAARGALPVGVQLIGRPFAEAMCLRAAREVEKKLGPRPTDE
jgi:aspartyl-tRNA(Asn)/glutamyl-tRNA(Gln) amidotransferase subunit A